MYSGERTGAIFGTFYEQFFEVKPKIDRVESLFYVEIRWTYLVRELSPGRLLNVFSETEARAFVTNFESVSNYFLFRCSKSVIHGLQNCVISSRGI